MNDLRQKTAAGVLWSFLDKAGSQLAGFLITILLARLLTPSEFGLVAMATAFFAISRIFIDAGLRDSLIQKKDAGPADFNTVFYFNIGMAAVLYLLIWISAPFIAEFYTNPELTLLIRVLGINIPVHSFSIVQMALITREMRFASLVKARMPAVFISGLVALYLAYAGYGVWSLAAQIMLESLLFNIFLSRISRWRPQWMFDRTLFGFHWQHGSRLLVGEGVNVIYRNIFSLVIGRFFSAAQLGLYNRADSFMMVTFNNTTGLVQTVSYPAMVQVQDDSEKLKSAYRKILQLTMLGTLPIYLLFMLESDDVIRLLLTEKWIAAAPILSVLSLAAMLSPFNSINLNILKVKRRTDLFLRLQLVAKTIFIVVVIINAYLGFEYLVYTNLIGAVMLLFINNSYTSRMIHYRIGEQILDMIPFIAAVVATAGVFKLITWLGVTPANLILRLAVHSILILITYLLVIVAVRRSLLTEAMGLLTSLLKRRLK